METIDSLENRFSLQAATVKTWRLLYYHNLLSQLYERHKTEKQETV